MKVSSDIDLKRDLVKSEWAVVRLEEIDFEIPVSKNKKGEITTVEGIFLNAYINLKGS